MMLDIIQAKNYEDMSEKACEIMVDRLNALINPILGFATGSTPEGVYKQLIEKNKEKAISFQNVMSFNLDEYVGLKKDDPNSYYHFMFQKLFKHIDILTDWIHIPNGVAPDLEKECKEYEQLIRDHPIDFQILGLGVNGHIGFNEPNTSFSSRTHIVELDESTRQANARFFTSMNEVPTKAITMGIQTIMESKELMLLASGSHKADAVAKLINGEISESFPASALKNHQKVTVIADEAALAKA